MLIAIYAEDLKHHIGYHNQLPWHLPRDLAFFKAQTWHQQVIMGRKTFQALGEKPLPGRKNIVLTTHPHKYQHEQIQFLTFADCLKQVLSSQQKTYIIGGKQIFRLFWPYLDYIYRTKIESIYQGDVIMDLPLADYFRLVKQTYQPISATNEVPLIFEKWKRLEI